MARNVIDIYPFDERPVVINPTCMELGDECFRISPTLEDYIAKEWEGKEKWDNAWIPMIHNIHNSPYKIELNAGLMNYRQTLGILKAIENGEEISWIRGLNNLSIGVIPVTSDGYAVLARRSGNVRASGVWNFPGGYMSSRFLAKAEGKNPADLEYKTDPRVFDLHEQVNVRIKRQEFYGLDEKDFTLEPTQAALAFGFKHSLEPEIGWVARFNKTKDELHMHIVHGQDSEHVSVDYVPVYSIPRLLEKQGDLLEINPRQYNPKVVSSEICSGGKKKTLVSLADPTDALLLDDNIGELIGGAYRQISGRDIDPAIIGSLRTKGWEINVFNMKQFDYILQKQMQ